MESGGEIGDWSVQPGVCRTEWVGSGAFKEVESGVGVTWRVAGGKWRVGEWVWQVESEVKYGEESGVEAECKVGKVEWFGREVDGAV